MALFKRKKKEEEKAQPKTVSTSTTYSGPVKEGASESLYRATGITASAGVGTSVPSPPSTIPTSTPTTSGIGKPSSGGSKRVTPTSTQELTGKVEVIGDTGQLEQTKYYIQGQETGRTFRQEDVTYAESQGGKKVTQVFTFDTGNKREVVELGGSTGGARISEYELLVGRTSPGVSGYSIQLPKESYSPTYGMTSTSLEQFKVDNTFAFAPGTIYSVPTGEYFRETPIVQTRVVQPTGESRLATREEQLILNPLTEEAIVGKTKIEQEFGEIKGSIIKFGKQEYETGIYLEKEISEWSNKGGDLRKVLGGFASGIIPTTTGEVLKTGAGILIGGGIGAGIKGASIGLKSVPVAGKYLAPAFKIGTFGAGAAFTGAYALGTAERVYSTEDIYGKGEVLGGGVLEFAALGVGFGLGTKATEKAYGLLRTRGRLEIPLERLTRPEVISGKESFPTAPPETHLQLLKQTIVKVPELAEGTPGGFHVTPEQFWRKGGEIVPQAGTSELPGLYVSSEPSIHFAKIGGSGYSLKPPTIKSILSGDKPAIAFLKPAGFREVGFREVTPYKIGDQPFKFAFNEPAKPGFIDIPKMKTEIEGVARPEAGGYDFVSGKYYTIIKGVRTPIDVFMSKEGKIDFRIEEPRRGKKFKAEEYGSLPESSSLTDLRSSLGRSRSSYSKVSSSYFQPSSYISEVSKSYSKIGSSSYINYSPRSRSYYGRSIFGEIPRATGSSYLPPYYSSSRPPIFKLPILKISESIPIIRGERLFVETPSFGTVLGKQLGISFATTKFGGYSGLGERAYKTGIKLPTTILWKVQSKEFEL